MDINFKSRSGRASAAQLSAMLDFFHHNRGVAEGRFSAVNGRDDLQQKWDQLRDELNGMNGSQKTTPQWQVVWRDLKSKTSKKARNIRLQRAATGNRSVTIDKLSELELRVISIVGLNYVEGSADCPDSMPEEEILLLRYNVSF
ncbi:uncharacterized protein [Prorops nasuta]|uniref:uncharacterized protein n=1 Tax=Prorops nasuta TaxID=863751 RepID=UPI0034CEF839